MYVFDTASFTTQYISLDNHIPTNNRQCLFTYVNILTLSSHWETDGLRSFNGTKYLKDNRLISVVSDGRTLPSSGYHMTCSQPVLSGTLQTDLQQHGINNED